MNAPISPVRYGFLSCAALAGLTATAAANWPGFRGLDAGGVARTVSRPIDLTAPASLRWKSALPPGHSSPVVWQDSIFLTGFADGRLITLCLDRQSGRRRWEQAVPVAETEKVHRVNSLATPTPVTDGKAVFAYFGSFGVVAYDFEGRELWRKSLPIPKTFQNQGTGTSPILAEGRLIVFLQLGNESRLLALNPADGAELWSAPMPVHNNTYATPVAWRESEQGFVGLTCAARFTAFRLADGAEAWWINEIGRQACSTPVVLGDRILIATAGVQGEAANITPPPDFDAAVKTWGSPAGDAVAYDAIPDRLLFTDRQASGGQGNMTLKQALRFMGGAKPGVTYDRTKWEEARGRLSGFATGPFNRTVVLCVRTGGKGDVTESHVQWRETKGVPEMPSPVVWNGRAYFIRSGGVLVCREVATGRLVFEDRVGAPGGYYASPIAADGRIYLVSDRGQITVVKAGDGLEVLGRHELGEAVLASPALDADTFFVRSAGHLSAFGAPGS